MAYTGVSLQGTMQSLVEVNRLTHFTHWTIGHSHMGVYAFVTFVIFGSMYYMLPRLVHREWPVCALNGRSGRRRSSGLANRVGGVRPRLGPTLTETQFGRWWCANIASLAAAAVLVARRNAHPAAAALVATMWVLSLVRLGHAAGYPFASAAFLAQFAHTGAVVGWFSALLGLTALVIEEPDPLARARLRSFSRAMLAAMLLIIATGTIRLSVVITNAVADWRSSLYLWILGAKLVVVLLVLGVAAVVRRRIIGATNETVRPRRFASASRWKFSPPVWSCSSAQCFRR
jgi:hypothetical protein